MSATQTLTLTDFLLARIAEDEARLDCGINAHDGVSSIDSPTSASCPCDFRDKREVEAKKRLVGTGEYPTRAAKALASVYADHADYRAEWKP